MSVIDIDASCSSSGSRPRLTRILSQRSAQVVPRTWTSDKSVFHKRASIEACAWSVCDARRLCITGLISCTSSRHALYALFSSAKLVDSRGRTDITVSKNATSASCNANDDVKCASLLGSSARSLPREDAILDGKNMDDESADRLSSFNALLMNVSSDPQPLAMLVAGTNYAL